MTLQGKRIARAFLCDARERDLAELRTEEGTAFVPCDSRIATVRMFTGNIRKEAAVR